MWNCPVTFCAMKLGHYVWIVLSFLNNSFLTTHSHTQDLGEWGNLLWITLKLSQDYLANVSTPSISPSERVLQSRVLWQTNCKIIFQHRLFLWGIQNNILKALRNPSWGNMLNSHQSEMCANKARQHYTPMGLFFSFTPIKMKLYAIKLWKVTCFVLQVSFEIRLNMHMSSTLIEYVLIYIGRKHHPCMTNTSAQSSSNHPTANDLMVIIGINLPSKTCHPQSFGSIHSLPPFHSIIW